MYLDRFRGFPAYGGLDLAAVSDLTAFVLAWPIESWVYVYPWFWIPEEGIPERSKRDNVPYQQWVDQGLVETTPGNTTDWRHVTKRIKQLASIFDIQRISFDRYGARDTVSDLAEDGIEVADVGQGFTSMSPPAKRLEELVLSRRIVHNGHPVLRWNMDCCSITQDTAGLIKPVKPDRMRTSKRIDGTVAMVMAIDGVMRCVDNTVSYPEVRSVG